MNKETPSACQFPRQEIEANLANLKGDRLLFVIPAPSLDKIRGSPGRHLDSVFQWSDDLLRDHHVLNNKISKGVYLMRATVTIEKEILDNLVKETRAKSKATAVRLAVQEYLKRKKIERIKSMKGKLEFDLTAHQIRHYER